MAKIIVHDCSFANEINPTLHKIITEKSLNKDAGAWMTSWKYFTDEFLFVGNYAINLIKKLNINPPQGKSNDFKIVDLWGQLYNVGDYQIPHQHHPNDFSFVYYVNTPEGSSPLYFDDTKQTITPKEGMMVLFESWIRHSVPENQCEGRTIIAGNIIYKNIKDFREE